MADEEGVLKRWHLRKTAAREGVVLEAEMEAEPEQDAALAVPEETKETEETEETDSGDDVSLDLPDPETLDADSDFSVFLGEGVPEEIQRLALRKLWQLDPVLANLDGLVDYGEDFTDASMVVEGMKTAYRVGKGWMSDEEIAEAEGEADAESGEASPETESPETESDEPEGTAPESMEEPDPVLSDARDMAGNPAETERSPEDTERSLNDTERSLEDPEPDPVLSDVVDAVPKKT